VVPAGSERVALKISDIFPDAPVFTSVYFPDNTFPEFRKKEVHTLPFSNLVKTERQFKGLYPLWYLGFSFLDLSEFDIIISSANYLAKFINPPKSAVHICYLHNPIRFLWKPDVYSYKSIPYGRLSLFLIRSLLPILRKFDVTKTRKIKHILTNSKNIANQIQKNYQLESEVVYPPVDVNTFKVYCTPGDYYLYAGRLISHKRVDVAINACNQLKRKLIVAGDGLERENLQKLAGDTVQFVGRITDEQLKELYANCKALIFPSDEDFGLVPIEVQSSGRPVIAYRSGGALETVVEDKTGVFFDRQDEMSLKEAILRFEDMKFSADIIRQNALRFDIQEFNKRLLNYVKRFE